MVAAAFYSILANVFTAVDRLTHVKVFDLSLKYLYD